MAVGASMTGIIQLISFFSFVGMIIAAIVLFIVDGVKAKRERRRRRKVFIVLFIVSMVLLGASLAVGALLVFLVTAFMASM